MTFPVDPTLGVSTSASTTSNLTAAQANLVQPSPAPVSPGQLPSQSTPTINYHFGTGTVVPTVSTLAPSSPAPSAPQVPSTPMPDEQYEQRIRDLQSRADKEAAARAAAEQKAAEEAARMETLIRGATEAAQQALTQNQELAARLERSEAEKARQQVVMEHPELRPYLAFLPATTDQAALTAAAEQLKAAREADLAAELAKRQAATPPPPQTPAAPAAPPTYNLYGQQTTNAGVPPASPARPDTSSMPIAPAAAIEADLRAAMEQALERRDNSIYLAALERAKQLGNAAAQQQGFPR